MTLVRYQNPLPNFLNTFFDNEIEGWSRKNYSSTDTTLPAVNIKENTDDFIVEVAAPGFEKNEFNIELENNLLTVSSDKKTEEETNEHEFFSKKEFSYQSFTRSFRLPKMVEREKITATYKQGILTITIPKREEVKPKPKKQITVK